MTLTDTTPTGSDAANNDTSTPPSAVWQLAIRVGDATTLELGEGFTEAVADVPDGVADTTLGAADLRARTAVVVPDAEPETLAVWAGLCGIAGRMLDVYVGGVEERQPCVASALAGQRSELERPAERIDTYRADASELGGLGDDALAKLRWARRVVLIGDATPQRYAQTAFVAGLRNRRGDGPRFPKIAGPGDSGEDTGVVDLEGARAAGGSRRRSSNAAANTVVVDPVELSDRQKHLIAAASTPVEQVLVALGSFRDGELWACPRPTRHTHGDSTPSAKISEGSFRCFRCDTEWVDPLRLVMDCLGVGPSDAANALLSGPAVFEPYKRWCEQTRERLSA